MKSLDAALDATAGGGAERGEEEQIDSDEGMVTPSLSPPLPPPLSLLTFLPFSLPPSLPPSPFLQPSACISLTLSPSPASEPRGNDLNGATDFNVKATVVYDAYLLNISHPGQCTTTRLGPAGPWHACVCRDIADLGKLVGIELSLSMAGSLISFRRKIDRRACGGTAE